MSHADELLSNLTVTAHEHNVIDTDASFTIDITTRKITNVNPSKNVLLQGDHNSERFTFTVPRYIEEHDLALCDVVRVYFINTENNSRKYSDGVYTVTDLKASGDTVTCSWLISRNATEYAGTLGFMVSFMCMSGKKVTYRWSTDIHSDIYVLEGIGSDVTFEAKYLDVIEQWKSDVMAELLTYVDVSIKDNVNVTQISKNRRDVNKLTDDANTLKSRVDNLAKLETGSTTGDAELMDIRVDVTGATHGSAGESVRAQINLAINADELVGVTPIYEKYVGYIIGDGYFAVSTEVFAVSNEIIIPVWAKTVTIEGLIGNRHIRHCVFITGDEVKFAEDGKVLTNYSYSLTPNTAELDTTVLDPVTINIPENAKAFLVSNNADAGGVEHPFRIYYKRSELLDFINELGVNADYIMSTIGNDVTVSLPASYSLVAGDTFELFYKGLVKAVDPSKYDIRVTCEKGNAYKRKYVWTPSKADIGEYELTVSVYNDSGVLLDSSKTVLNVVAPLTATDEINILCIGDSLTAGGQWVSEVKKRLSNETTATVNFIGKKTGCDANFEATGGWFYTNYLALDSSNPFYDVSSSSINIKQYVVDCGVTNLDVCIILLGWNGTGYSETIYKNYITELLSLVKADFPDVKILLFGVQIPSADGLGENYGASVVYKDMVEFVFNLDKWHDSIATADANVRAVNISGQFDTDNNMPSEERPVNIRNVKTEVVGINGVHPDTPGYYQIADVAYRELNALL